MSEEEQTIRALIEMIKKHMRVDHSHEDDLIRTYFFSALEWVERYTQRCFSPITAEGLPPSVFSAVMLIVADLYENREAQQDKPLSTNKNVLMFLHPLRRYPI